MRLRTAILVFPLALFGLLVLLSFQKRPAFDLQASIARGRESYVTYCLSCHMDQGEGVEGIYPPLAKADYLMADKERAVRQIIFGARGEMVVNGKTYNAEMTGFDLPDQEVSDLVNYIRNSFGNKGGAITPEQVQAIRKK